MVKIIAFDLKIMAKVAGSLAARDCAQENTT